MGWFREKLSLLKILILSFRIEPMGFLFVLSINLSSITSAQLIQDKFCRNNYNMSRQFCIELEGADTAEDDIINNLLADVATYSSYIAIISTLPGIMFMLFFGSWLDHYIHARKITLCFSMLAYASWFALMLLNAIYFDWGNFENYLPRI